MNCRECQENLIAYLEDVLPEAERQQVAAHLQSCPTCSDEAAQHARLRDRLLADGKALGGVPLDTPVMDRILREETLKLRRSTMRRKYGLIGLGIAAAVALAVVLFWPSHRGNGIAWADVVRQIQTAGTAHLRYVMRDPTLYAGKEFVMDMYLRSPGAIRCEDKGPSGDRDRVIVSDGQRCVIQFPKEKRYGVVPQSTLSGLPVADCLALFSGSPFPPNGGRSQGSLVRLGDKRVRLVDCGLQIRDGRSLRKYRLEPADEPDGTLGKEDLRQYCWLQPTSQQVTLATLERTIGGALVEVTRVEVRLNIKLPEELFSTALPSGYTEDADSVAARGLEDLYAKYEQARDRINRYRLIAWENRMGQGIRPVVRCARNGKRYRVDELEPLRVPKESGFEEVWAQLTPNRNGASTFLSDDRKGRVLWDDGKVHTITPHEDDHLMGYAIAGCGWPKWPLAPLGTVMDEEASYRQLPDRPDKPGLIGIRYEQFPHDPQGAGQLVVLWIDPAKDYLCVSYADHSRYGDSPWTGNLDWQPSEPVTTEHPYPKEFRGGDKMREIIEFGQTADGQWYPVAVRRSSSSIVEGKRYQWETTLTQIQVDFTGPIPADLFDWPAEPPKRK